MSSILDDPKVVDWRGVSYAVDSPRTVLLSTAVFSTAMRTALAADKSMTYTKFKGDSSKALAYNPTTKDALFTSRLTILTLSGYYQAYPARIGQTRLSQVIAYINANGWPELV